MTDKRRRAEPDRVALIADDDAAMRLMVRTALEQDGWIVEEAKDGTAACAAIERSEPDVVLLDVSMPGLDGFDTCAELRKRQGGDRRPVMMITSMDDNDSIGRAYNVGATDFLSKPVNFVVQRVQSMYRAKQAAQELQNERDFVSAVVDTAGRTRSDSRLGGSDPLLQPDVPAHVGVLAGGGEGHPGLGDPVELERG